MQFTESFFPWSFCFFFFHFVIPIFQPKNTKMVTQSDPQDHDTIGVSLMEDDEVTKTSPQDSINTDGTDYTSMINSPLRPVLATLAIIVGFFLFFSFHTLPEYCEAYVSDDYDGNDTNDVVATSSGLVEGINIIFLIQAGILVWFGCIHLLAYLYAIVNIDDAIFHAKLYTDLDAITGELAFFVYLAGGIVIFVFTIVFALICDGPILFPLIAFVVASLLLTPFGNAAICLAIGGILLALAIVTVPFYMIYKVLVAACCRSYVTVSVTMDEENPN